MSQQVLDYHRENDESYQMVREMVMESYQDFKNVYRVILGIVYGKQTDK